MKKLLFSLGLFLLTACFSNQLLAQTPQCTPAQKAACQKMSTTDAAKCKIQNPTCQKTTAGVQSTKVAAQSETQSPYLQVINEAVEGKKPACKPTCKATPTSAKLTKNNPVGCQKKNEKLVLATAEN